MIDEFISMDSRPPECYLIVLFWKANSTSRVCAGSTNCSVLLWPLSRWGGCHCKELKHMWPYFCDWSVSTTIYCFICPELVTVCTGTFRSPYQISLVGNFTILPELISFSKINSQSKARSCIFTILRPEYTSIKYNK